MKHKQNISGIKVINPVWLLSIYVLDINFIHISIICTPNNLQNLKFFLKKAYYYRKNTSNKAESRYKFDKKT